MAFWFESMRRFQSAIFLSDKQSPLYCNIIDHLYRCLDDSPAWKSVSEANQLCIYSAFLWRQKDKSRESMLLLFRARALPYARSDCNIFFWFTGINHCPLLSALLHSAVPVLFQAGHRLAWDWWPLATWASRHSGPWGRRSLFMRARSGQGPRRKRLLCTHAGGGEGPLARRSLMTRVRGGEGPRGRRLPGGHGADRRAAGLRPLAVVKPDKDHRHVVTGVLTVPALLYST
jgi:hypothetical protein